MKGSMDWEAVLQSQLSDFCVFSCSVKWQGFSTSVNQKLGITIFTWARQLLSFLGLQTWRDEV